MIPFLRILFFQNENHSTRRIFELFFKNCLGPIESLLC
ncbi:hypothetical protein LEP1GSC170_5807 [Leptospira interrogans serovar Bataviae str. HAI135]|nr:hypothetical protein LEP1GSC170_5807 [Leptospira interrogans serovar Bataviae str. HAI135]